METQKIVNLMNDTDNGSSKFAKRKWCVINDQNKTKYGKGNENDTTIKNKHLKQKLLKQIFVII